MRGFLFGFLVCVLAACAGSAPRVSQSSQVPVSLFGVPPGPWEDVGQVPIPALEPFTPRLPEKIRLSNGITVLLLEDASRPLVSLDLRFRVGSWDDPRGKTGLAALTAGLVRDGGSERWPGDVLDEELDFLGASIDFSASDASTKAGFSCLSGDVEKVYEMFQDLLLNPTFPEEKLDVLKGQLMVSVLQRNDRPGPAATRESRRAFYGIGDPRVRRMEASDLDAMGRDDVVAFHRESWGSRGALFTVLGDFNAEDMAARLEATFGTWPVQPAAVSEIPKQAPRLEHGRVLLVDRADVNQAEIRILMEGVRRDHPDWPALRLGSFVLGAGGFGSRMMRRIRAELGLTYGVSAYWNPGFEQEGLFTAQVATKNETAGQVVAEMLSLMKDFLNKGPGVEELDKAKMRLLNSEVFRVDTPSKVLNRIADLEFQGYPWNHYEMVMAACRDLTGKEIVAACRRHLDLGRLQIFVVGNAPDFDVEMGSFGPLALWDLDSPDISTGNSAASSVEEIEQAGRALAERVLVAHGGRDAWTEADLLLAEVASPRTSSLLRYPNRISWREHPAIGRRDDRPYNPSEELGSGWSRFGTEPRLHLPLVLMRLARNEAVLGSPAEGILVVECPEGEVVLSTGGGGVVTGLAVENILLTFGKYSLSGGLRLPGLISAAVRGEGNSRPAKGRVITNWQVNPDLLESDVSDSDE